MWIQKINYKYGCEKEWMSVRTYKDKDILPSCIHCSHQCKEGKKSKTIRSSARMRSVNYSNIYDAAADTASMCWEVCWEDSAVSYGAP